MLNLHVIQLIISHDSGYGLLEESECVYHSKGSIPCLLYISPGLFYQLRIPSCVCSDPH